MFKLFPLGFRTKIAMWSAAASGLAVLAFSVTSAFIVFDNMREEADAELRKSMEVVFERARAGDVAGAMRLQAQVSAEPAELHLIELFDSEGDKLVDKVGSWGEAAEFEYSSKQAFGTIRANGESWGLLAQRDSQSRMKAKLVIDLREITLEVTRMVKTYLWAMPAAMAFAALGGWWVAGRAAKPIKAIAEAAERVSAENLGRRVPELEETDEISRLATVLNRMISRLQDGYRQAQRFSSDASHELRTPIAVLQGKIEEAVQHDEASREVLAELGEQVARLKSIVESLLLFSRADGGHLQIHKERIKLHELLGELAEDLEAIAETSGIDVSLGGGENLEVEGDPRLLRMAVFNLLQNAVKYNLPSGGKIVCRIAPSEGNAVVSVRNTGPEIPVEDREAIFERFFRREQGVKSGITGTGLGLSLTRLVAQAHSGEIALVSSGSGWNEFELRIPLVAPAPRSSGKISDNQ